MFVITDKQLDAIFNSVAALSRYKYWNEELWRDRVEEFRYADKAEVQNAFMIAQLNNNLATSLAPIGCSWACEVSEERSEDYLKMFKPIFDDYWKWQLEEHG